LPVWGWLRIPPVGATTHGNEYVFRTDGLSRPVVFCGGAADFMVTVCAVDRAEAGTGKGAIRLVRISTT
jgi:hypothetical protein